MIKKAKKPHFISGYIRGHKRAFYEGIVMPWKHPVKTMVTILTLAICFYIPLLLWTLWLNYEELQQNWQNQGSIAVFISPQSNAKDTDHILAEIKRFNIVSSATLLDSTQIKSELVNDEQFSQISDIITTQDLPQQISINVSTGATPEQMQQLLNSLENNTKIEYVSYDRQWLSQIQALTHTLLQMARVSAVIFILIVMVILANIITNEITDHKNELRLLELIGASWAQVRRSFLYMGTLLGIYAATLSVLFISLSFWWLKDSISSVLENFGMSIQLHGLNELQVMIVLLVSLLITWLATRLSLSKPVLKQLSDS